jgi:hypothetical protein
MTTRQEIVQMIIFCALFGALGMATWAALANY